MSELKVYNRRKEKLTCNAFMEEDGEKGGVWMPETPEKLAKSEIERLFSENAEFGQCVEEAAVSAYLGCDRSVVSDDRTNLQQNRKFKKVKRKKHRPKVVIDRGQEKKIRVKRELNLETPKKTKENASQRRKYVRGKRSSSDILGTASANSMVGAEVLKLQPVEIERADAMLVTLRMIENFALILKKTRSERKRRTYGLRIPNSCRKRRSRRICAVKFAAKRMQLLDIDLNQTQVLPAAEEQTGSTSTFHDKESSLVSVPLASLEQPSPCSESHNHENSLTTAVSVNSVEKSSLDSDFDENPVISVPLPSLEQPLSSSESENSLVPAVSVDSVEKWSLDSDFHNDENLVISVPLPSLEQPLPCSESRNQENSLMPAVPVHSVEKSSLDSDFLNDENPVISVPLPSLEQPLPCSESHNHENSLTPAFPVYSVENSILNSDFDENPVISVPLLSLEQPLSSSESHNDETSLTPAVPVHSVEKSSLDSDFNNDENLVISVPVVSASQYAPAPLLESFIVNCQETDQPSTSATGTLDLMVLGDLDFWADDYELIRPQEGFSATMFISKSGGIKRSQLEFIIKNLQSLYLSDEDIMREKRKQIAQGKMKMDAVPYQDQTPEGALVPYGKELEKQFTTKARRKGKRKMDVVPYEDLSTEGALVPSGKEQKQRVTAKVDLDEETKRVWNNLMNIGEERPDLDEENAKWWEGEREAIRLKIDCFVSCMHLIQGDRQFREWKGSVVDSVVGVFLTQNVTDVYSSSAFMSLGAKFGRPTQNSERGDRDVDLMCSQESVGSNSQKCEYFVSQPEPEQSNSTNERDVDLLCSQESVRSNSVKCEYFVSQPEPEQSNSTDARDHLVNMVIESNSLRIEDITSTPCSQEEITLDSQVSLNHELEEMQQCDTAIMSKKRKLLHSQEQDSSGVKSRGQSASSSGTKNKKVKEKVDWDALRRTYSTGEPRNSNRMDSVNWEAVRSAHPDEVADTIKDRGQHNTLAGRIQDFLNGLIKQHGSMDLEWLRNVPPDKAKDYLLDVPGLGLKSVECIRLLSLQQVAFPVDTNVGRIAVRLGWVPLQTLPEEVQIHLLDQYPLMDTIQKYLWPRLCTLDQQTLYELHYQLITFGKVFCTMKNPNCNACPMKGDCRHYASAFASARLALPAPPEKRIVTPEGPPEAHNRPVSAPRLEHGTRNTEPIIEEPEIPDVEDMLSPKREVQEIEPERDSDGIPIIRLNVEKFTTTLLNYLKDSNLPVPDDLESKALVALDPVAASTPARKLKYNDRLKTGHLVYELPPNHCLLDGFEPLEPDDICRYHLAIWLPGETPNSVALPQRKCNSEGSDLCDDPECYPCNNTREQNSNIVRGTILIPCRTATRGSFPLNGTYFQSNEVFADHQTSHHPMIIPRDLIYNLRTRTAHFGSSTSSVTKDLSTREIQVCFWQDIVCFRGFDRSNGAPKDLVQRLHKNTYKMGKIKGEQ